MTNPTTRQRRLFLPLADENSAFPYSLTILKAILLGYHITVTDAELSQAMTGVDNPDSPTSLMQIAQRFGLELEQTLLPADHLYLADALPALVMMRPIPEEPPHWAVVWQRIGPVYQVVDPKLGRLWLTATQLLNEVNSEAISVSAEEWRAVANTPSSQHFLQARLTALGLEPAEIKVLLDAAYTPGNEFGPAILDAALRTVEHVVQKRGFQRGPEAAKAVAQHYARGLTLLVEQRQLLTPVNWAVLPDLAAPDLAAAPVQLVGVSALRIGELVATDGVAAAETEAAQTPPASASAADETAAPAPADVVKRSALDYLQPERKNLAYLIVLAMLLAGAGLFFQAILFRSLAELSLNLGSLERRSWAMGLLLLFTLTMTGLKWFNHGVVQRLGHRLDGRLRLAVLARLPRLSSHYFQDIPAGDMIERIHNVRVVRKLPFYLSEFTHIFFQFIMTIVGLLLLDWLGALITFVKLFVPFFFIYFGGYLGSETERTRTYLGFLSRFYLDAMEGLVAIRTHGAEQATRREYEGLLGKWVQSNINVYHGEWRYNVISTALSYGLTGLVIFLYAARGLDPANLLLVAYWSVNLESLRGPLIFLTISYLFDQAKAARFLEMLDAPVEEDLAGGQGDGEMGRQDDKGTGRQGEGVTGGQDDKATGGQGEGERDDKETGRQGEGETEDGEAGTTPVAKGVAIALQGVSVVASGQRIFKEVDLTIPAGSQIGIVGPSGAGKSTLVGLLLGWHYPASGTILIDGLPFDYARLQQLRADTAWVDPTIQLWNRSFLYNLRYGGSRMPLNMILDQADLRTVLERLPDGMQTKLGGEGRLVSGGEGQRMRFGRALQRADARLVILDEPFRGLDREKRRTLLARARAYWPHATMLCITHDVGQTQDFERVLVVEDGQIVEDDAPQALLARPGSRYQSLLAAEDAVREKLWSNESWRRLWLENGHLQESKREAADG